MTSLSLFFPRFSSNDITEVERADLSEDSSSGLRDVAGDGGTNGYSLEEFSPDLPLDRVTDKQNSVK